MTLPRSLVRLLSDAYIIFALTLSTDAFLTLLRGGNDPSNVSEGSPVFRFAWAFIYLVTIVRTLREHRKLRTLFQANKSFVCFVLLMLVSASWSIDASSTAHFGLILMFTTLFSMDFCIRYPIKRQVELVCTALLSVAAMSVIAEVFFSGVIPGNEYQGSAWHGVFGTKNEFGRIVVLGVTAYLSVQRPRWVRVIAMGTGAVLAILAQSVGAVAYLSVMIGIFAWLPVLKWKPKPRRVALVASSIAGLVAISFVSMNFTKLTDLMGRDPHMTGRTVLWQLALDNIRERPILGYGYDAFWSKTSHPANLIREASGWKEAPHSHNGYIDLALGVGALGLVMYLVIFGMMARRAYLFFVGGDESYRKWPLAFLFFVFAYQLTESSIVTGDTIVWILYCCLAFTPSLVDAERPAFQTTPSQSLAA